MSDYDKYLSILATEAADNSYSGFGKIADALNQNTVEYVKKPGADVGEAMLYSSVLGLLGGGLDTMGKEKAAADLSLASKVLTGDAGERDPGLSPSLYSQAKTYRDLIAKDREIKLADDIRSRKLDRAQNLYEKLDEADLDLDYIGKRYEAEQAAKRKSLLPGAVVAEKGRVDLSEPSTIAAPNVESAGPMVSEFLPMIQSNIPPEYQKDAMTELGTIDSLEKAFSEVDTNMDEAFNNSTFRQKLDPKIPYVAEAGIAPSVSEEAKKYETAAANLTSNVLKIWKGPLDENDARRIVDPYIPDAFDNAETLAAKKRGLKALLAGNSKETPILTSYGIRNKPNPDPSPSSTAVPARTPTPGGMVDAKTFAREGRAQGLSNEQIIERWNRYKADNG